MSRYIEIKLEIEECMCTECFGTGVDTDVDGVEEICPCCQGSGINPEMAISLDIDKA